MKFFKKLFLISSLGILLALVTSSAYADSWGVGTKAFYKVTYLNTNIIEYFSDAITQIDSTSGLRTIVRTLSDNTKVTRTGDDHYERYAAAFCGNDTTTMNIEGLGQINTCAGISADVPFGLVSWTPRQNAKYNPSHIDLIKVELR